MLKNIKNWLRLRKEAKARKQRNLGYSWARVELLSGRSTAQGILLWIDMDYASEWERGAVEAVWYLIDAGAIMDDTL